MINHFQNENKADKRKGVNGGCVKFRLESLHSNLSQANWNCSRGDHHNLFYDIFNPNWKGIPFLFWTHLNTAFQAYNPRQASQYLQVYIMSKGIDEASIDEKEKVNIHGKQVLICREGHYPHITHTAFPPSEIGAFFIDWNVLKKQSSLYTLQTTYLNL